MDYILFYKGNFPDYATYSINNILNIDSKAKVYLCTDVDPKIKDVKYLDPNNFMSEKIKSIIQMDIYKNSNYENNNLWINSLLRVFYLESIINNLNINSFVHFDLDVLIFKPFSELEQQLSSKKINITRLTNSEIIFSYSFIPNIEIYNKFCELLYEKIVYKFKNKEEMEINEMELISLIEKDNPKLFNILPSLPYDSDGIIFDPATYGQYFGGTHNKPRKFYQPKRSQIHHIVGTEINSKRINPKLINKIPYVIFDKKSYEIANLHIHSKNIKKFLI